MRLAGRVKARWQASEMPAWPTTPRAELGAAQRALRLALGIPVAPAGPEEWAQTFAVARRESLFALCWLRSADTIRSSAPPELAAAWRGVALRYGFRTERRLERLVVLRDALASVDAEPVLLKGMALSQRLYGDPAARVSGDVDVYVAAEARPVARACLRSLGWRLDEGMAPWEEAFDRVFGRDVERLEVHSFLLGDLLAHLPTPLPETELVRFRKVAVRALAPAPLAVTLAVHLARHRVAPLLWFVDYAMLWNSLVEGERRDAWAAARRSRVELYLAFAIAAAARVPQAVGVDVTKAHGALRALGVHEGRRDNGHPMWRDLRFAGTAGDLARVSASWALPPAMRAAPGGLRTGLAARAARVARRGLARLAGRGEAVLVDPRHA